MRPFLFLTGSVALAFAVLMFAVFKLSGSEKNGYPGVTYFVLGMTFALACFGLIFRRSR